MEQDRTYFKIVPLLPTSPWDGKQTCRRSRAATYTGKYRWEITVPVLWKSGWEREKVLWFLPMKEIRRCATTWQRLFIEQPSFQSKTLGNLPVPSHQSQIPNSQVLSNSHILLNVGGKMQTMAKCGRKRKRRNKY